LYGAVLSKQKLNVFIENDMIKGRLLVVCLFEEESTTTSENEWQDLSLKQSFICNKLRKP